MLKFLNGLGSVVAPVGVEPPVEPPSGVTILAGPYNFNDNVVPSDPNIFTWTSGGGTLTYANGYAEADYPANISDIGAAMNINGIDQQEVYISLRAQMPDAKHGVKFVKLFGVTGVNGYANVTFGLDYTGIDNGAMLAVSYGDGSVAGNQDTQHTASLNESVVSSSKGRNAAAPITAENGEFASTDWGTEWHDFRLHFKHSSGLTAETEVADGEIYVEIDGVVKLHTTGIFTRHFDNGQNIGTVRLFDWSQGNGPAFKLNIDDVVITSGGFDD